MLIRLNKATDRNAFKLLGGVSLIFFEVVSYAVSIIIFYDLLVECYKNKAGLYWIISLTAMVGTLSILRMVFTSLSYRSVMIEAYKITSNIRTRLADHLKKIPFGYLMKKNLGNLSNAVLQDTNLLDFLLSHIFIRWIRDIFAVVLLFGIMFYLNPTFFYISVGIILCGSIFFIRAKHVVIKLGSERFNTVDKTDSLILEYIQGISVMKSFGLTGNENKKLLDQLRKLAKDSLKAEGLIIGWGMLFTLTIELGLPIFIYFTLNDYIINNGSNMNSLLFIISYILMSLAMFDVMQYALLGRHMISALSRIEEMFEYPTLDSPSQTKKPEKFNVTFSNVSFAYDKGDVLHNITFNAEEKSLTALVGHSGAGKSTITNLIPLFWNSYRGKIKIGDIDIKQIKYSDLMNLFSFVFQEVYLFNDTVYNNILCGRKNATYTEVIEASKKAHCHEFIKKLPNAYDTLISEGGTTLSGGQKQRISLARAILKNAPIVILDEATTALDPINESFIQKAITELIHDKTVITIAHRLYTITNADKIIVFEKGRIVSEGNHKHLIENCDIYRQMLAIN